MFLVQLYRDNKQSFYLMLWMAIMPLLCSTLITIFALKYEAFIEQFAIYHWMLFYLITSFTMAFALTPTTFIALLGGYFLGWASVPYMLLAYLVASAMGYLLARKIDQGKLSNSLKHFPKAERLLKAVNQEQFIFILLCRISPVLPFAIMNVTLSMIKVQFSKFLWAGFIGMLPRTLLFIWVGSTARLLQEVISGEQNDLNQIGFLILLIISIAGFYFYFKTIITNKLAKHPHDEGD